jgi:hypothetical protein
MKLVFFTSNVRAIIIFAFFNVVSHIYLSCVLNVEILERRIEFVLLVLLVAGNPIFNRMEPLHSVPCDGNL